MEVSTIGWFEASSKGGTTSGIVASDQTGKVYGLNSQLVEAQISRIHIGNHVRNVT